jgi:uncharacterized protein
MRADGPVRRRGAATASRLVAKVDSAAIQDGFDLYLHGVVVANHGHWVVVQQGMNGSRRQARRYHWLSESLNSFVDELHSAIEGADQGVIINLTDHRAEASRQGQRDLLSDLGELDPKTPEPRMLKPCFHTLSCRPITMSVPAIFMRAVSTANLATAAERRPKDFSELLLTPGAGARTVKALAMVAEVVHGAPCRFSDPAWFSRTAGRTAIPTLCHCRLRARVQPVSLIKGGYALRQARTSHGKPATARPGDRPHN